MLETSAADWIWKGERQSIDWEAPQAPNLLWGETWWVIHFLFPIAVRSKLEIKPSNGTKQYDKDETPKCHVWTKPFLRKPGKVILYNHNYCDLL